MSNRDKGCTCSRVATKRRGFRAERHEIATHVRATRPFARKYHTSSEKRENERESTLRCTRAGTAKIHSRRALSALTPSSLSRHPHDFLPRLCPSQSFGRDLSLSFMSFLRVFFSPRPLLSFLRPPLERLLHRAWLKVTDSHGVYAELVQVRASCHIDPLPSGSASNKIKWKIMPRLDKRGETCKSYERNALFRRAPR